MDEIRTKWAVILASFTYFLAIGFINTLGSVDIYMLNMFKNDEAHIYKTSIGLLRGNSFYEHIKYFLNPEFKMYGYIYHFFNAVSLIIFSPFKTIFHLSSTQYDILILRQLNVLYFLVAAWVLIFHILKDLKNLEKILSWILIISTPATFQNNLWIHTDNLGLLFITLSIFFLVLDNNRFQRYFYLATVFWGLSINTKFIGIFIAPMFLYNFYTAYSQSLLDYKKINLIILKCLILLILTYIVTTPYLFIGNNFKNLLIEILNYSRSYITGTINVPAQSRPINWYEKVISLYFFKWYFIFPLFIGFLFALRMCKRNTILLVSATLPLTLHLLVNVGWVGFWYLIPCLVPLMIFSCFLTAKSEFYHQLIKISCILIILYQIFVNLSTVKKFSYHEYYREKNSVFLKFSAIVQNKLIYENILIRKVYLDSSTYYPPTSQLEIVKKAGFATYEDIDNKNFDLLIFQRNYINYCSDIERLMAYVDYTKEALDSLMPCHYFYKDVREHKVHGFRVLYENADAIAYVKN